MSNQQRTAFEENFDPSTFNFNQYLQQQKMPQMQTQFADIDSQFSSQQNQNGYNPNQAAQQQQQQAPDTFRNPSLANLQNPVNDFSKLGYQQQMLSQFQGLQQVKSNDMQMNQFQVKDNMSGFDPNLLSGLQNFQGGQFEALQQQVFNPMSFQPQVQQQQLIQELLKAQTPTPQSQQMNPLMMPQMTSQSQAPPLYGQGFLNAAQLLASIQQLQAQPQQFLNQQPLSHQPSTISLADLKQQQPQVQQQQQPNLLANQQMMSINSNLQQYQAFIDQLEKGNNHGGQNTATGFQRQSVQPSQQQLPQSFNQYNIGSGGDLRQPLQQSNHKQNYNDIDPNQSLNSYLMQNVVNEQENQSQLQQKSDIFTYDNKQAASSKERYNPNAYSGAGAGFDNQQKPWQKQQPTNYGAGGRSKVLSEDGNYEGYIQSSPPKQQQPFTQAKGRENYSPQSNKMYSGANESMPYLQNNQYLGGANPTKLSTQNSPLRSSDRGYNYDQMLGGVSSSNNFLENSFRNHNPNNAGAAAHHNASHGSNSILQEHHLNTFQNRQQNYNQYSPGQSSQYKYDEGENNFMNSSQGYNRSQRAVNIDDIPVGGKAKTFEELLEANLRQMGGEEQQQPDNTNYGDSSHRDEKKQFLKRKSQKAIVGVATKKYNYYVDNFEEGAKKKRTEDAPETFSKAPEHQQSKPKITNHQVHAPKTPQPTQQQQPPQSSFSNAQTAHKQRERELSSPANDDLQSEREDQSKSGKNKKPFLARGSGTAGGKSGHTNQRAVSKPPAQQQQQQQQQQQPKGARKQNALSDDEYPNDFNFAAEQDNKSPKPTNIVQQQQQQKRKTLENQSAIARSSISEFEKIEQECNDKYSPKNLDQIKLSKQTFGAQPPQQQQVNNQNKRRKKLFDDSDSNDEDQQEDDNTRFSQQQQQQQVQQESRNYQEEELQVNDSNQQQEAPKSNVVKKFFYKEDPAKQQRQSKQESQQPQQVAGNNAAAQQVSQQLSEQMERILKQKMEQLDKAIEQYNQEHERALKMKKEYENMVGKQRVEYRDFETKKKKELEEIEKIKLDEVEKIKKEKKTLEQRTKNLQLVNSSNKKEREEIDFLKKELQRVADESKAKETKQKQTIERLNKQVEELKSRNKELTDEVRHFSDQLRQVKKEGSQIGQGIKQQQQQEAVNTSAISTNQRYTFSSSVVQPNALEQSNQKQPKGILKNKNEVAPLHNQDQDYMDNSGHHQERDHHDVDEGEEELDEEDKRYVDEAYDPAYEQQQQQQQQVNQRQQQQQQQQQTNQRSQQQQQQQQQPQRQNFVQEPVENKNVPEENTLEEEEDFDMKFPQEYHNKSPSSMKVVEQIIGHDGKIQRVYENGKKEVIFNNGVKREVFPDGYTIVYFNNSDIKQTYADQKVVYYFAEAKTTQSTFPDGLQVFKFANNQIEKHFPDGTKEIIFPDGTIKCIFADGEEESIFPDGTIQRIEKSGVKAIEFANGQKDILFPDGTRIREYPDGRVRKTYPDGTYENTYRQ